LPEKSGNPGSGLGGTGLVGTGASTATSGTS